MSVGKRRTEHVPTCNIVAVAVIAGAALRTCFCLTDLVRTSIMLTEGWWEQRWPAGHAAFEDSRQTWEETKGYEFLKMRNWTIPLIAIYSHTLSEVPSTKIIGEAPQISSQADCWRSFIVQSQSIKWKRRLFFQMPRYQPTQSYKDYKGFEENSPIKETK